MITVGFGIPGCGKSTLMACITQLNKRKKDKYYEKIKHNSLYEALKPYQEQDPPIKEEDGNQIQWIFAFVKYYACVGLFNILFKKNFYDVIYCTDPTIQDTVYIDYKDLGCFKPTWNSLFILEEAGIGLDNRSYKELTKHSKRFAAMHRHAGADLFLVSQTVDVDKAYRQRAEVMHHITKLGPFTLLRRIVFRVDVDENTHQLIDGYFKIPTLKWIFEMFSTLKKRERYKKRRWEKSFVIYRPAWYSYFNSYIDDYDYPMEDPYITLQKILKESENTNEQENSIT